jgi:hypothetical protein
MRSSFARPSNRFRRHQVRSICYRLSHLVDSVASAGSRSVRGRRRRGESWRDTANRLPTDETIHECVESAQDQYVMALRHAAGKSYPSPDRYGRAASCTRSRTVFCTSGERARRVGEADAAVSVT